VPPAVPPGGEEALLALEVPEQALVEALAEKLLRPRALLALQPLLRGRAGTAAPGARGRLAPRAAALLVATLPQLSAARAPETRGPCCVLWAVVLAPGETEKRRRRRRRPPPAAAAPCSGCGFLLPWGGAAVAVAVLVVRLAAPLPEAPETEETEMEAALRRRAAPVCVEERADVSSPWSQHPEEPPAYASAGWQKRLPASG